MALRSFVWLPLALLCGCAIAEPRAAKDPPLPPLSGAPERSMSEPIAPSLSVATASSTDDAPPPAAPQEEEDDALPVIDLPRSGAIRNGFYNPMPGGIFAGYAGDTGLDIAGSPRAVYAIAAGTLDYSEPGHTRWTGKGDTANSVRFELDAPIAWKKRQITHVYYTHLSALVSIQPEGAAKRRHVEGGEQLGTSGIGRGVPHLHIGMLLDGNVEQDSWDTILVEAQIRQVIGGYKNGELLPQ